jgi:hypothetical protein
MKIQKSIPAKYLKAIQESREYMEKRKDTKIDNITRLIKDIQK